ncbi:VOC family protein [Caulobacter sp. CCNWLY153]|jgi:catechol 2,3-dioxygenase-like lactoylglutathione lyase family enzyme|uniref:VOC family protein n=1 Tax=Caulobacter radicis TaxID=2172650 RepID=A0A2T9IY19_9CAUL|nr:VOC family protein [Caulobacter radicis]PVM72000.1 VOC family protein [Caulobacter radicis]
MQMHRGRMIDHIQLRTQDLAAMKRFYTAVLEVIGVPVVDGGAYFYADEMWVDVGEPATHIHLAFQARDREAVQRFHEAGLAAGGRDNGGPGEREYHPGYYAAFLLDPDGNNIEAVYHGPHERSADSVVLTWEE